MRNDPGAAARHPRTFFATGAADLAPRLIGARVVRALPDGTVLAGTIVETEAYLGARDRASHAFGGRRTARNEAMYAQPGTAYVYFTYGMHYCMNVVCAAEGDPQAVLIRALEPDESSGAALAAMRQRRGVEEIRLLCSGPGRLCRAFEIDRRLNAIDLCTSSELWIERGETRRSRTSARIGIGSSGAWVRRLLRWYDPLSPSVSRRAPVGKRSVRPARARKSP